MSEEQGWVGSTGEFGEGAPEGVQSLMTAKGWTNVEQMAGAYSELEKFKGIGDENHLSIPEGDDAEAWGKVFNKLGRPEKSDGYIYENKDSGITDDVLGDFFKFGHKEGYTQKQLTGALDFYKDAVTGATQASENQKTEADNIAIAENELALKKKYGAEGYKGEMEKARAIADRLGIFDTLESKGHASDVAIIEMLLNIDKRAGEDPLIPDGGGGSGNQSPEAERDEIEKHEGFTKRFHSEHKRLVKRHLELCTTIANNKSR